MGEAAGDELRVAEMEGRVGPLLLPKEALKNTHIAFLRTCCPPTTAQHLLPPSVSPEGMQDREGAALEEAGPARAGHWQQAGACQSPKGGGTWRTGHMRPEKAHGGVRPKKERRGNRIILLENQFPTNPEAKGHARPPVPTWCRSSSERLRKTESLESLKQTFQMSGLESRHSVDKVPLGAFQVLSLESHTVWAMPRQLFCFN